ncbi:hypothetical protein BY996DRAFT_4574963 [Phakopsora pachyrhizi]|uniref:Expressed protein n=1 Tax=Phakopsora pachyrhizi TaxID=170000 RepID=A0AAV0BEU3_PHAPC|nr:hypothetical protein BY996DRAFT_4574963 [Phakopsora pachyrhizi]CAH7685030.1 expressed protein [Phakopsora pachyrhizi]
MPEADKFQSNCTQRHPSSSRRQSIINMSPSEHGPISPFAHFPYESGINTLTLASPREGILGDEGNAAYSQLSGHYQLGAGSQSGHGSPASNQSSPNPYADFSALPLSPPSTGGTMSSFISQQRHSPHGNLTHPQPLSPIDLSSSSPSGFEFSRPTRSSQGHTPSQLRRGSHSATVAESVCDRRTSAASSALRNFNSSFVYSNYAPLDSSLNANSSSYFNPGLQGCASHQSCILLDPSRQLNQSAILKHSPALVRSGAPMELPASLQLPLQAMGPPFPAPSKLATRQYRKKTPPEACAVCGTNQTPEWRKGPSGLRTLCNACGLTAAKQTVPEPQTLEEVWKQLLEIGLSRFRGNYDLTDQRKAQAAQNWASQSQFPARQSQSGRSYSASGRSSPSTKPPNRIAYASSGSQQSKSNGSTRAPVDINAAQQLFSMSRGREISLESPVTFSSPELQPPCPTRSMRPYDVPSPSHGGSN